MKYEAPKIETFSARRVVEALGPAQAGGYGGAGSAAGPSAAVGGIAGGGHVQKI